MALDPRLDVAQAVVDASAFRLAKLHTRRSVLRNLRTVVRVILSTPSVARIHQNDATALAKRINWMGGDVGLFSRLIGADTEGIKYGCLKVYREAKERRPGKPEVEYLRMVLLTKPPFDYQSDGFLDGVLSQIRTIEELAGFIAFSLDKTTPAGKASFSRLWESRERNVAMFPDIRQRNEAFFEEFWA